MLPKLTKFGIDVIRQSHLQLSYVVHVFSLKFGMPNGHVEGAVGRTTEVDVSICEIFFECARVLEI